MKTVILRNLTLFKSAIALCVVMVSAFLAIAGEIHDLAKEGRTEKVQSLLKDHPDLVSATDDNGYTPLFLAADTGQKDVVKLLIASGADVNFKTGHGETPLAHAVVSSNKDVAELLLAHGADINYMGGDCQPVLLYAAAQHNQDMVKLLLQKKANLFFISWPPIWHLISNDREFVAKLAFDGAKDVRLHVIEQLTDPTELAKLATEDASEAVREAATRNLTNQLLLANLAATDKEVNVRYVAAGRIQDTPTLDKIAGSDINRNSRMKNIVELRKLATRLKLPFLQDSFSILLHVDPIEKYYNYGGGAPAFKVNGEVVDISIISNEGIPLAHNSWSTRFPTNLASGTTFVPARVSSDDGVSITPDFQTVYNFVSMTNLFQGLPSLDDIKLCAAARDGDSKKVETLLKENRRLALSKDGDGMTALHYAAKYGHKDAVQLLLVNGANINAKDLHNHTPLGLAKAWDQQDVANLLTHHGGRE